MIPPLLVLIRMLDLFICSKALLLKRCCSSGEKAQVMITKSDTWTNLKDFRIRGVFVTRNHLKKLLKR